MNKLIDPFVSSEKPQVKKQVPFFESRSQKQVPESEACLLIQAACFWKHKSAWALIKESNARAYANSASDSKEPRFPMQLGYQEVMQQFFLAQ